MGIDGTIGGTDRTQAEIVRPAGQLPIQPPYHHLGLQQGPAAVGFLRDAVHQPFDALRRRPGADVGPPGPRTIAASDVW